MNKKKKNNKKKEQEKELEDEERSSKQITSCKSFFSQADYFFLSPRMPAIEVSALEMENQIPRLPESNGT